MSLHFSTYSIDTLGRVVKKKKKGRRHILLFWFGLSRRLIKASRHGVHLHMGKEEKKGCIPPPPPTSDFLHLVGHPVQHLNLLTQFTIELMVTTVCMNIFLRLSRLNTRARIERRPSASVLFVCIMIETITIEEEDLNSFLLWSVLSLRNWTIFILIFLSDLIQPISKIERLKYRHVPIITYFSKL